MTEGHGRGAAAPRARPAPPRRKLVVVTWLALYPALNRVFVALEPLGVTRLPLLLRTMVVTLILVPAMVYWLMPLLQRLLAAWLREP